VKRAALTLAAGVSIAVVSPFAVALAGVAAQPPPDAVAATDGAGGTLAPGSVPAQWRAAVQAAGSACPAVSPPLIAAQIEQESGWNPTAVSPARAVGLSQFMPGTWAGQGVDANHDGAALPTDPLDAIATQGHYDCALAADLAGVPGDRQDTMLAGYNAGSAAVIRYGAIPPYAQTQGYVRRIRTLMVRYAAPTPPATTGRSTAPGAAGVAIAFASARLGQPYLWGGTGPLYDCSGLVQAAYAAAGIALPRTSEAQQVTAAPVTYPRPGDLVFMGPSGQPGTATHVGIVIGGGLMVDDPHPGAVVRIEPYTWPDLTGFGRIT